MSGGEKLKGDAEKILKRTTIFGFGKNQKFEDAAETYIKAANAFKMSKQWQEAADCYLSAANCQKQTDSPNDSVNSYVEAGNCYKKMNSSQAADMFITAVAMYEESGRIAQAARYLKEIAEIYEQDNNTEDALSYYQRAADANEADNKKQGASQCLLKIATLASGNDDFSRAATIFEQLGTESMSTTLGAYSAKGHFFSALLCYLASGDAVATRNKLERYKNIDHTFPQSRECQLITNLLEAVDNFNSEDFSSACADFNKITPLDPWKTSMLLKAKKYIVAAAEEDVDLT